MDAVPDAIYVKDTESRFVLANHGEARHLGAAGPEELYGKTDLDFCPSDLARQSIADEQALVQSGRPLLNREESVIDANGERRWMLTSKTPLPEIPDGIVGLAGIGRDITERKRAETKLVEANAELLEKNEAEDFNAVIQHSLWLVNFELTRSRISLAPELAAGLPRVRLDRAKMEQVFIN